MKNENIQFINCKRNTISIRVLTDDLIEIRLFSRKKKVFIYTTVVSKRHFFNKLSSLIKV